MSMLESYGASATAREVMQTWVMFGDPSTLFRNQETQDLSATHVDEVPMGTTSINVNCDVEDATVAISQDGVFLGKAKVVGGVAAITFEALSSTEPLTVVATKQNYRPYIGEITVLNGYLEINETASSAISVYPNPANEMFTVAWTDATPERIELRDLSGKVIFTSTPTGGTSETFRTAEFATGVYLLNVTVEGNTNVSKLIIR